MEYARVDLPEPFGPMIAWVSPALMVRSTPLRISLRSPSASTVTWRLRISRVLMRSGLLVQRVVDVDIDDAVFDLGGIDRNRVRGGQAQLLARAQVEFRAVQPAVDDVAVDVAFRQGDLGVGADVVEGVELLTG